MPQPSGAPIERIIPANLDGAELWRRNGEYVSADDYEKAEARIAELETALDEIHGAGYAMSRGINGGVSTMCVPISAWNNAMQARNPK